ncbi:MAG: ABC transporter permease [Anaerolineaceae bacterium]|nr:MAG: ABC transporter permease [Anaerolineaceae bacterium]
MTNFILRRLFYSIFVVIAVTILVFLLSRLTGDPALLYLPETAPMEMAERFREMNGLNRPIPVQLWDFIKGASHLDFGKSIWQKIPASELVLSRLPLTLKLAFGTTFLASLLAILIGIFAAVRPLSLADSLTTSISLLGVTLPSFWLALLLILIFSVDLRWLPTSGSGTWKHAVLPLTVLTWGPTGYMARVVRSSVFEQLSSPYVIAARARGVRPASVLFRHVLPNAALPIITVASSTFIGIANGAVIVETVFGWPGIGKLTIDAISNRDFPVLQATVFVVGIIVVLTNLVLDLLYAMIDPRIRLGKS